MLVRLGRTYWFTELAYMTNLLILLILRLLLKTKGKFENFLNLMKSHE